MQIKKDQLSAEQRETLVSALRNRFQKNINRHPDLEWEQVETKLKPDATKLWSLHAMEQTGGAPDVVGYDEASGEYIFYDCSPESPNGRRSICYDREGLESRKKHKPENTAIDMATDMGIELLTEDHYRILQNLGDFRYGHVFVYHNGAQSYYASRGFRGSLKV